MSALRFTPWRVVNNCNVFEVWTREDVTPGSRNNYIVADGIQSEADANAIAAAPDLLAEARDTLPLLDSIAEQFTTDDGGLGAMAKRRASAIRAAIAEAEGRQV